MAIPEAQLQTWSALGSVQQSAQTYQTIRNVLNDARTPYHSKSLSTFLQGSYGNNTNVYRDSDVDIVICLDQTYYSETTALTEAAKANYDRAFSLAQYQHKDFKAEVFAWLQACYGATVTMGKKAIAIKGSGTRRDADVLVCAQHRRYLERSTGVDSNYVEGVIFWNSDGTEIVNFPKQHSENCTAKHRSGPKNLDSPVSVISARMGDGIAREERDDDGKKAEKESRGGVQGTGGVGGDSGREDLGRDRRAVRGAPAPDHGVEKAAA